ncbi:MAG: alpha-L-fucosidase [Gemmatimonadetes bacterium]|nr:alpha-L-fucosidase [Gemmatimonadota bacterium]
MTDRLPTRRDFIRTAGAALGAALPFGAGWRPLAGSPFDGSLNAIAPAAAERMAWWREARFGMFVHWGLYSILAGEWEGKTDYGEWIRNNAKIPIDEYGKLLGRFDPTKFDADRIARLAADAGQKYLVMTTKHHDGFCLWPTRQNSDWNVARTPYRRDIMRQVADACRSHGVKPCWYHSIMDWHHPDYLPRRDWEAATRPPSGAQFDRYVRYLHAQVEELLTHYGDIGVMWFDGEWESTWNHELGQALAEHVQKLAPNTLINSRVGPSKANGLDAKMTKPDLGDFGTPEQKIPDRGLPGVDWESCVTMNGNWGYNRADHDFKSVPTLVNMLVETASKGGNLLLNIGPTGDGTVPPESVERLAGIGRWMRAHGEAIHGTLASPFEGTPYRATRRDRRLNCFFDKWPSSPEVLLPGVRWKPEGAFMLGDPSRRSLDVRLEDRGAVITLPAKASDDVCSVLAVDLPIAVPATIEG